MKARRGTSNANQRGSVADRRRRREFLVVAFAADKRKRGKAACRCYRCGELLTSSEVTVDRIIPGCRGGSYRRNNIRPACGRCNSITGATTRSRRGQGKDPR